MAVPHASSVRVTVSESPDPKVWRNRWPRVVDAFIRDLRRKGHSNYTIRDYRADVMRLLSGLDVAPDDLSERHLEEMDARLSAEGMPEVARRRRRSAWRKLLSHLNARRSPRGFGGKLLGASRGQPPQDRLLLGLVCLSGLRLCEVAALEGRDLRPRKHEIISRSGCRVVPMHPWIVDLLDEVRDREPLAAYRPVISGPNGYPVNARTLHARFARCVRRIGGDDLRPDLLRREASELLTQMGTPPGLVIAFLGKDRGRVLAPRRGKLSDLTCLRNRIVRLPTSAQVVQP